jgi:hypothetical protein
MWNPFWPPIYPGYSFFIEFCPGTRFCSFIEFLLEQFWISLIKEQIVALEFRLELANGLMVRKAAYYGDKQGSTKSTLESWLRY